MSCFEEVVFLTLSPVKIYTHCIMSTKGLDYESLNENMKNTQYAIRGELYLRALELQAQGKEVDVSW